MNKKGRHTHFLKHYQILPENKSIPSPPPPEYNRKTLTTLVVRVPKFGAYLLSHL